MCRSAARAEPAGTCDRRPRARRRRPRRSVRRLRSSAGPVGMASQDAIRVANRRARTVTRRWRSSSRSWSCPSTTRRTRRRTCAWPRDPMGTFPCCPLCGGELTARARPLPLRAAAGATPAATDAAFRRIPRVPDRSAIALAPEGTRSWLAEAVEDGGAHDRRAARRPTGWCGPTRPIPAGSASCSTPTRTIDWVQLPWAGIEPYVDVVRGPRRAHVDVRQGRVRRAGGRARAGAGAGRAAPPRPVRRRPPLGPPGRAPTCWAPASRSSAAAGSPRACCACSARSAATSPSCAARRRRWTGAARVVGEADLDDALRGAQLVVLALALTPATTGILDRRRLELLDPDGWVVNVARGAPHRHRRPRGGAGRGAHRRRRPSTSPIPSRCPTGTRCGTSRGASSRRTPATPSRWPSRCSPSGCARTCGAAWPASRSSAPSIPTRATDPASYGARHGLPHHHGRRPRRRRRAKRISARELVGAALARIEEVDAKINAFVALDEERALADAAAIDARLAAGEDVGPLAGHPDRREGPRGRGGLPHHPGLGGVRRQPGRRRPTRRSSSG